LKEERTSFQSIKDGMRRDMAIRYLSDGRKNIEEISDDLGFSSSSNFYRAFRRWTGETPSKYIEVYRKV
jgi:AraC-like DNA-binding protein